jgi:tripartite ATP-independent transporter DctM subunit
MDIQLITVVIVVALLLLLLSGYPIAFGLLSLTLVGCFVFVSPTSSTVVFLSLFNTVTKDIFIAIPLFIFMAAVLQTSKIGERMYATMYTWFAGLRGGLAIGTVFTCTVVAAMTGLGGTGTLIMGMLAYPEMRARGYDKELAIGCIPAGGALGPLIPPSLPMILIAALTGVSLGKLFMAGVIPGLICSMLFMIYIAIRCLTKPSLAPGIPVENRVSWKGKMTSLSGLLAPIMLILLVLGGIYSGAFTPTEAGGIGAVGALICAISLGNFTLSRLIEALTMAFKISIMAMWLAIGGSAFSALLGITGITTFLSDFISGLPMGATAILILMMFILFIMGMFIETASVIMIAIPVLFPLSLELGFDPLWFSFLASLNIIIGMISPPFGYGLFYFKGLGYEEVSMTDIYRAVLPYVVIMVAVLLLCMFFTQIPLALPNMMH